MRIMPGIALGLALAQPVHAQEAVCQQPVGFYQPPAGMIGTARTAMAIALAYLNDIYGEATIRRELPLHAVLNHGVWTVTGSISPAPHLEGGNSERYI